MKISILRWKEVLHSRQTIKSRFVTMTNSGRAKMDSLLFKWVGLLFLYDFMFCSRQWLKSEDIQRISLFFHNKSLEKEVEWRTSAALTPSAHQPALTHCCSSFFYTLPPSCPLVLQITCQFTPSESWARASEVPQISFVSSLKWWRAFCFSSTEQQLCRPSNTTSPAPVWSSSASSSCRSSSFQSVYDFLCHRNCPPLHSAQANAQTKDWNEIIYILEMVFIFARPQNH